MGGNELLMEIKANRKPTCLLSLANEAVPVFTFVFFSYSLCFFFQPVRYCPGLGLFYLLKIKGSLSPC